MIVTDRIEQINRLLPVLQSRALADHLLDTIDGLTERLIGADNEQTRGRIKALRDLLSLPDQLQSELAHLTAGLGE